MSLTENLLKAPKPSTKGYKVADGRSLYIEGAPTGSKLWRYRYRIGKIEKKLSIGTYPWGLKSARVAAPVQRLTAKPPNSSVRRQRLSAAGQ